MIESTDPLDHSIARLKAAWAAARSYPALSDRGRQAPVGRLPNEEVGPSVSQVVSAGADAQSAALATLAAAAPPTTPVTPAPLVQASSEHVDRTSLPPALGAHASTPALPRIPNGPIANPLPPPITVKPPSLWRRIMGVFSRQ